MLGLVHQSYILYFRLYLGSELQIYVRYLLLGISSWTLWPSWFLEVSDYFFDLGQGFNVDLEAGIILKYVVYHL